MPIRCPWAAHSPEETLYHDTEWGVPSADDRRLFEFLVLESAQAGLSWLTILRKRENYRRALAGFDPEVVARFGDADQARLLADPGIVRNRLKVNSAVVNARAFLRMREERGSFAAYVWGFVDGRPRQNAWESMGRIPVQSTEAVAMSKDMKRRGFTFCGPTICQSFMQAVGLVNDHLVSCFRHAEVAALGAEFRFPAPREPLT
jgi:DNA-3-methyladenine glycosylase I